MAANKAPDITRELAPFAKQVLEGQIKGQREAWLRNLFMRDAMKEAELPEDNAEFASIRRATDQSEAILVALEARLNKINAFLEEAPPITDA